MNRYCFTATICFCSSFDAGEYLCSLWNSFAISSMLRPFVSGTQTITKTIPTAHNAEYIQKVPAVVISCNDHNILRSNISNFKTIKHLLLPTDDKS